MAQKTEVEYHLVNRSIDTLPSVLLGMTAVLGMIAVLGVVRLGVVTGATVHVH